MREAEGSERAARVALPRLLWPAAVLLLAGTARAGSNDLNIPSLGNPGTDPTANERFRMLSNELGMSFAGTTLETPKTVGINGFDVSLEAALVFINATNQINGEPYWATNSTASAPLIVPALHVRKGLPYSFEVGAKLMTVTDSGMFAGQAEIKWALIEGFRYVPDLSARIFATELFSQEDLGLTAGSAELSLGKEFGIAGLITLTPYLGYCLTGIQAESTPFLGVGTTQQQFLKNPVASQQVYAPQSDNHLGLLDNLYDRFHVGLQLVSHVVAFNVEYDLSLPSAFSGAAFTTRPAISTVGLRLALQI